VVVVPPPTAYGGGVCERREEVLLVPVLGVLARGVEESIRRTDGARWRRRVRKEYMDTL